MFVTFSLHLISIISSLKLIFLLFLLPFFFFLLYFLIISTLQTANSLSYSRSSIIVSTIICCSSAQLNANTHVWILLLPFLLLIFIFFPMHLDRAKQLVSCMKKSNDSMVVAHYLTITHWSILSPSLWF